VSGRPNCEPGTTGGVSTTGVVIGKIETSSSGQEETQGNLNVYCTVRHCLPGWQHSGTSALSAWSKNGLTLLQSVIQTFTTEIFALCIHWATNSISTPEFCSTFSSSKHSVSPKDPEWYSVKTLETVLLKVFSTAKETCVVF